MSLLQTFWSNEEKKEHIQVSIYLNDETDSFARSYPFFLISFPFSAPLPHHQSKTALACFLSPTSSGWFSMRHSGYLTLHASRATKANFRKHLMCCLQWAEIGKVKRKLAFLLTIFQSAERVKWALVTPKMESRGEAASCARVCLGDCSWGKEGIRKKKGRRKKETSKQRERPRVLQNKKGNWKKVHLGGKKHVGIFSTEGINPTLKGKNSSKVGDEVRWRRLGWHMKA